MTESEIQLQEFDFKGNSLQWHQLRKLVTLVMR